jgi:hypothetical protein
MADERCVLSFTVKSWRTICPKREAVPDPWARPFVGERPRTTKLSKLTTSTW